MKTLIVSLLFLLSTSFSYSQTKYFMASTPAITQFRHNGLPTPVAGASYKNKRSNSFHAAIGVFIHDNSRIRLDLGSLKLDSKLTYPVNAAQPSEEPVPVQTEVIISSTEMNINYDHYIFRVGKFGVMATTGVRTLLSSGKSEVTIFDNGQVESTDLVLPDFKYQNLGVGAGVIAKYDLNEVMSITFTPNYTHYFYGFNRGGGDRLSRFRVSAGVEVNLWALKK